MSKIFIRCQNGASLIELLLVTMAVGFMVVLIASIPNSIVLIGKSQHLSLAKEIAVKQLAAKRTQTYSNLSNGSTPIQDSRLNLLPSGTGSVTIEDCSPAVCTGSEQVKQITVAINWRDNGKDQNYQVKSMIANGGLDK